MWSELTWVQVTSLVLNFLVVVLSLFLIMFFSFKSKRNGSFFSFIAIQVEILIWGSGLIMEIFTEEGSILSWLVLDYYYLGICSIGVTWLIFSFFYTEQPIIHKRLKLILLYIPSVIFYVFLITNHYHYLFYKVINNERYYGIIFLLHTIYSYSCIIVAMFLLIRYTLKNSSFERGQVYVVILSAIIPFSTNILFLLLDLKIKITCISFILSSILFTFATYKLKFMNIVPVSLIRYVDYMNEAVIVVNRKGLVENCNISFKNTFRDLENLKIDSRIDSFLMFLKDKLKNRNSSVDIINAIEFGSSQRVVGEICVSLTKITYFFVTIQPVLSKKGETLGRVVSFSNVNEYKQLLENLNEKNIELSVMNDQLIEYASKVEELAVVKERNRIAKDIHDSVGHMMTVLISLLGVCKMQIRTDLKDAEIKVDSALKIAKEGLNEVRKSIKGFTMNDIESVNIIASLENLVDSFRNTGVEVDYTVEGKTEKLSLGIRYALFRACQEALTNSVRHGKATHVSVILFFEFDYVKLFIIDNGKGCESVVHGMGLKGMSERVRELDGTISYGPNGDTGFNIHIEIPLTKGGSEG